MGAAVPTEARDVGRRERARTDEAHFTTQNVDELRELIETGGPQHSTDARDPTVPHGPELVDRERTLAEADAVLHEQR
jgi:hypothetical protein